MKKILFAAFFTAGSFLAQAQTESGTQYLGLSLSFYSNHRETENNGNGTLTKVDSTHYALGPQYSYFIADKMDVGGGLGYGMYKLKFNYDDVDEEIRKNTYYYGEIFLRKYFLLSDKFGMRAGPYVYYEKGKGEVEQNDATVSESDYSQLYAGVNLDIVYYPLPKFGVSANIADLNYGIRKNNYETADIDETIKGINFHFINKIGLTVFYILGK